MQKQSEHIKVTTAKSAQVKTAMTSGGFQFEDHRPETSQLQQLQGMANQFSAQTQMPIQQKSTIFSPAIQLKEKRAVKNHHFNENGNEVVQRLTDDDITDKADKKTFKKLRGKFNKSLGYGSKLYLFAEEAFDYYFEEASSLEDLGIMIDAAIATAEKKAASAEKPKAQQMPSASPTMPATAAKSTGQMDFSVAPKKKEKKKKKSQGNKKGMSLDDWEKQNPQAAAAPVPMNFANALMAPAPPQAAPQALAPIDINDVVATNVLVNQLIGSMVDHTVDSVTHTVTNPQTVYYDVVILGPITINPYIVNRQQNRYTLKLHYHPDPNTNNWLHLKRSDAGSPDNVIATNNAILAGHNAELKKGQTDWETTRNGGTAAPQGI